MSVFAWYAARWYNACQMPIEHLVVLLLSMDYGLVPEQDAAGTRPKTFESIVDTKRKKLDMLDTIRNRRREAVSMTTRHERYTYTVVNIKESGAMPHTYTLLDMVFVC